MHLESMAGRLPALYRDGALLQGLLSQPALQQMIVDEELTVIQKAHFFELTRDFEEARRLADLLGLAPEPESSLREFRSFVTAFRDAIRLYGTTTLPTIRAFVTDHLTRFQQKVGIQAVPNANKWRDDLQGNGYPALVENPPRRKWTAFAGQEAGTPLQTFEITNQGLDPSYASWVLMTDSDVAEASPCLVNLTNGQGVLHQGVVKPGQRLWLRAEADGSLQGQLEHRDTTQLLTSFDNWTPGEPLNQDAWVQPAKAIRLETGLNQLAFFPLAQFNQQGLDRFLLAMPGPNLSQGRFNQGQFNQALFHQDRRVRISMTWIEKQRATFQIRLPMAALLKKPTLTSEQADHTRTRLQRSLDQGVNRLKAAGTAAGVVPHIHLEGQRQLDYLRMILPIRLKDGGVIGKDGPVKKGANFDQTSFDDSLMA